MTPTLRVTSIIYTVMAFSMSNAVVQQYNFPCYGSRVPSRYPSSSHDGTSWMGPFSASTRAFQCSPLGFGVTPNVTLLGANNNNNNNAILESELSVAAMKEHFSALPATEAALAVELWITLPQQTNGNLPSTILTVGQPANSASSPADDGCEGSDLRLLQKDKRQMRLYFRQESQVDSCQRLDLLVPPEAVGGQALLQILVVMGTNQLSLYRNGQSYFEYPLAFSGQLSHWHSNYRMQLFSDHVHYQGLVAGVFSGSLHQLSLHDRYLTSSNALKFYMEGLERIREGAEPRTAPPLPNGNGTAVPTEDVTLTEIATPEGIPVLLATANETFRVLQGHRQPAAVALKGLSDVNPKDTDGWWTLKCEIVSAPRFGVLTTADGNNQPIQAGRWLDMTERSETLTFGVDVLYSVTSADYFNVPRVSDTGDDLGVETEFLEYRIHAVDAVTEDVLASSKTVVRLAVHVIRVNQPSKLVTTTPNPKFEWTMFTEAENRPQTYFRQPIKVQDSGVGKVDRVRIGISTNSSAFVSLNEDHRHLADFGEACKKREYSFWHCVGSGDKDRRMTFLAYPSDVELIMKDMVYTGVYGEGGQVKIQVWDGQGGDCLSWQEHSPMTYENGQPLRMDDLCFADMMVFDIEMQEGESAVLEAFVEEGGLSTLLLTLIIVLGITGCLVCLVGCWLGFCRCVKSLASGQEVHVGVDDLSLEEKVMGESEVSDNIE